MYVAVPTVRVEGAVMETAVTLRSDSPKISIGALPEPVLFAGFGSVNATPSTDALTFSENTWVPAELQVTFHVQPAVGAVTDADIGSEASDSVPVVASAAEHPDWSCRS
jgi:hypothetical protein